MCYLSMYYFSHSNLPFIVCSIIIEINPVILSLQPAGAVSSLSIEGAGRTLKKEGVSLPHFDIYSLQVPIVHSFSSTKGQLVPSNSSWQPLRQLFHEFGLERFPRTILLVPQRMDSLQVSLVKYLRKLLLHRGAVVPSTTMSDLSLSAK